MKIPPGPQNLEDFRTDFLSEAKRLRMRHDPIFAFEMVTGKAPYEYQKEYLLSDAKRQVIVKSRQTGFTYAMAFKVFWLVWTGRSESEIIISVSKRAAETVGRYVKDYFGRVGITDRSPEVIAWNNEQITVKPWRPVAHDGNCSVFILPQNPSTIRSLHGNLRLDEAAHYEKGREILEAALPFTSRGYAIDAVSTPRGRDPIFHDTFWMSQHFKKMEVPWNQCPDLTRENLQPIWDTMDEESIRQEYFCEFVDESTAFMPYELIMQCVDSDLDVDEVVTQPLLAGGVDIGRKKDATEAIGLDAQMVTRWMKTFKNTPFREQLEYFRAQVPLVTRTCFDQTGLGMNLVEDLQTEFGSHIEPVTFTMDMKEMWATNLKVAFEKGIERDGVRHKIRIPNNRELINQIHAMRRAPTATGIRFDVDKNEKHHGDKFWALALAIYAGWGPNRNSMDHMEESPLDDVL